MWWAVLAGCASHPLSEVPIDGGTPELRLAVARTLAAFEAASGPGRIELRQIRLRDTDRYAGRYNTTNRTLSLSTSASTSDLFHELCHALFTQEDLGRTLREGSAPIDAVVEQLFADPATAPHLPLPTPARRRSEAVATLCAPGPLWAADAGRTACEVHGDDQALAAEVGAWMLDHVWSAYTLPEPLDLDLSGAVAVTVPAARSPSFQETTDPGVVRVDGVPVDLYGGGPSEVDAEPVSSDRRLPPGAGALWISSEADRAGWPLGPAGIAGTWFPRPLSASAPRIVVHDGEAWRFLGEGCGVGRWFFTADEQLWVAWRLDDGLAWAPLAAR